VTRLVIADDHALIRAGFRQLAARDSDITVVGEAADGKSLLALLTTTAADVVALDISMPGPGFQELIRAIRAGFPRTQVLVVSMYKEGEVALRAIQAGAAGYVTKTHAESELLAAIRRVARGGRYVTPSLAEWLAARLAGESGAVEERLSDRERHVLMLLAQGKSYKEVGAALSVSPKTVSTYRSRVLRKLGLKTTADLVRYVVEHEVKE
jgi:DNA-binding NarL/FixJ family response regulator